MANDPFEYDVGLSFGKEDRGLAEELKDLLTGRDIHVLLSEYQAGETKRPEADLLDHLVNLYARKARYCVLLISRHYPLPSWSEAERVSVTELALRDADEYILPLQVDDREIPGAAEAKGYRDLRRDSMQSTVDWLEGKLRESKTRSGPPSQSHDLRSGNVPHEEQS
jgi:hypothetical protein